MNSQQATYSSFEPVQKNESVNASRRIRLLSYIIDFFSITPLIILYQWYLGPLQQILNGYQPTFIDQLSGFILFLILFLLFNSYLLNTRGQTVGKLLTKTKIENIDGTAPNIVKLMFLRYLPQWIVAYIPIIWCVVLLDYFFIFGKKRMCIHDYIAKTRVVKI